MAVDVKLKRKISKAAGILFENSFKKTVIEPNVHKDKMYMQLGKRLFRLMLFADGLYYECSVKRIRMSDPKKEFIGMQFELFFLYLRTVYDYFAIIINKEIGNNNLPNGFHKLAKKINNDELNEFEKNMKNNFVKFIHGDYFFKMKDIRDSIKMRTTTLDVVIKNNFVYVQSEDKKVNDFGYQVIFNHCWMTAGWMLSINDLITKNKNE